MKKFLVGVATANVYSITTGDLLFSSRTMLENAIAISTSNAEIRAGQGNSLQYVYFYSGKMELTLKEAQFNLSMIAASIGSTIQTGKNVYFEETVALGVNGAGVVTKTPLTPPDNSAIYGWVTDKTGNTTKVTFTGKNFTLTGGQSGDNVCVRYYESNTSAKSITVSSNVVPSIVRVVLEAQLASDSAGSGILGTVQVEIPRLQFDGSNSLSLKSSGVSETDLKGIALSYIDPTVGGCTNAGYYATITETINSSNWYDDVYALAAVNDSIVLDTTTLTELIDLRAVPILGSAFKPTYSDITFTSSTPATCTVDATGQVTKVAVGTSIINCIITNKNTVSAQIDVTVTA